MTLLQEKNIPSAKILPLGLAISIFSYVFRLLFHKNIHRVTACTHKIHPKTVDLLGLKVIRENYRKERDDYKIDLVCGPQEIELFIIKNAPARVNYPEALGLRHLAFKVESVDDTVKELNGKGIETEPVRLDDYTGKKMTFFHDPDGLPLEIHE